MTDVITSTSNPRVRAAAALARRRDRVATGLFLVEGPNAVADALADGVVDELFCIEGEYDLWWGHGIEPTLVSGQVLERIATTRSPQGVVATARMRPYSLRELPAQGLVVACHEASDPGNAGTLVRVADAVAAAGVVLCEGSADPWGPKAVRAAAGSITHLPIVTNVDTASLIRAGMHRGRVVALDGTGDVDVDDVPVDRSVTLLAGSEAHGLPEAALDACDVVARLPMWGRTESLNLATAVAVAAYSLTRRARSRRADR